MNEAELIEILRRLPERKSKKKGMKQLIVELLKENAELKQAMRECVTDTENLTSCHSLYPCTWPPGCNCPGCMINRLKNKLRRIIQEGENNV